MGTMPLHATERGVRDVERMGEREKREARKMMLEAFLCFWSPFMRYRHWKGVCVLVALLYLMCNIVQDVLQVG